MGRSNIECRSLKVAAWLAEGRKKRKDLLVV